MNREFCGDICEIFSSSWRFLGLYDISDIEAVHIANCKSHGEITDSSLSPMEIRNKVVTLAILLISLIFSAGRYGYCGVRMDCDRRNGRINICSVQSPTHLVAETWMEFSPHG